MYSSQKPSRQSRSSSPSPSHRRSPALLAWLIPLVNVVSGQTTTTSIPTRWGQASALVGSLLVVQGGKTQGTSGGGYTYSSAPSDAQMYTLDLSSAFPLSSPPWQAVTIEQESAIAPAVSFHTISPLNSTSLLLFGGDGSPVVPVQTGNDSAYIVHLGGTTSNRTAAYQQVPTSWNQPMRREWHTSESNGQGSVWIVGGERADGSGTILDQQWTIDTTAASPSFQLVPSSPPGSLAGSTSTMLSDGTILMLGGMDASGQLQSLQDLYAFSSKSGTWSHTSTQSAANGTLQARQAAYPAPRRDHIAVSLPDQRVFIQGGASADLSTVYSDAWILDWSVNPPVWTQVDSADGPGARYGHSAVAYGREVLISFGWQGGNAAPSGLHVFDASNLTASTFNKGSWSGGSWSATSYTPDTQMSSPASTPAQGSGTSSGSSSSGANGSSSSSGVGTSSSSGSNGSSSGSDNSGGSSNSNSGSGSFPAGNVTPTDGGSANTDSHSDDSSGGAKAGAAVGAIIGAGLVVGAGYAVYRRRTQNDYRRYGESKAGILGFGGRHNGGSADDDLLMEKGFMQSDYNRPYHHADGGAEDGAGLTGGVAYGRRRGRTEGSPWVAGNMGHAMEGSGPHFRERIAILAGRSRRESQAAPRFDMLADEGDGSSVYTTRQADSINRSYADGADEPESPTWPQRHMREHSYANAGDEDLSSGDIGQFSHDDRQAHDELDMYSPFEDRPEETRAGLTSAIAAAAGARGYGKLADRDLEGSYDSEHRSHDGRSDLDTHEDPSVQSHSTTSRSDVPSSSKSYDVTSSGGIVSFSDASHGRQSNSSNGMKRSSTWWDRLTGHSSAMERSSSGRLLASPHANLPIRDPAPPPVSGLAVITESARSREVSEVLPDPFADSNASGTDEHGRRVGADGTPEPYTAHTQGPSLSSIGSARTGASSHFESQLRGMDVIQRVRTGSSRRTQSTRASDTDSEPALSRGPTLLRPRNIPSDGNDASTLDPASKRLGDLVEEPARRPSNVSETPSITPLTTKRARLNPVMISPLFPSTSPRRSAPLAAGAAATVRDKVRAFESATSSQDTSAWTASMSSVLPRTAPTTTDEGVERATSPPLSESAARRPKVVHGLAPRPQLFVANPDAHGRRTSGSDGSGH